MKAELVWTNPNPNNDFPHQTLSIDMTNYEGAIIETYESYSTMKISRVYVRKGETRTMGYVYGSQWGTYAGARAVELLDSSLVFDSAIVNGSASDSVIVPYKIYGVKTDILPN